VKVVMPLATRGLVVAVGIVLLLASGQSDTAHWGATIGKARASGSSAIVAYVNGHPITAADIAEGRARVAANLDGMRDTISRIIPDWQPLPRREGTPLAPGEFLVFTGDDVVIREGTGLRKLMEERIEIIEKHGADAAVLAQAVRDQALFTAATAAGHTADPADIAARIAEIRVYLAEGHLPDLEAQLSSIDEDVFFNDVLPSRLARELAVEAWREEVFADVYSSEGSWREAEEEVLSNARVTLTGKPGLDATLEDLSAYQEAYRIVDAPPTPMPECEGKLAAYNPDTSGFLLHDCSVLLAAKDTLQGTGDLNWSLDMRMTRWDGVTVEGTPKRVTILDLSSLSLTGTIPTELSRLTALLDLRLGNNLLTGEVPVELWNLGNLETLWLHDNRLTGDIPPELGELPKLESLKLSGNTFTGCIPSGLRNVPNQDLDFLGLSYCVVE